MSRSDAASITLNFNLPPEVIREYFDGLAKVESAKRSGSDKSFDWSSLLAFAPLLLPVLSNLSKSYESPKPVRVPEKFSESKEQVPKCSDVDTSEGKPDIVISFVQKPVDSPVSEPKVLLESTPEQKSESSEVKESDAEKSSVEESKDKKVEDEKKTAAKPRRPVYQDGDNVVLDLKDLTGAFGANGGAPLVDMMKMFGPMMEGLMGGMGGMASAAGIAQPKSSESSSKSGDAVDSAVSEESKATEEKGEDVVKVEDEEEKGEM